MRRKLSPAKRRLLIEMADNRHTMIAIQRHPRKWQALRYAINSFPMRRLRPSMIEEMVHDGYMTLNARGQLVLSTKGILVASIVKETIKTREELACLRS